MTYKSKTPTPFWGRSCAHYGDGYGIPCPHFGDALSLFWGRFSGFLAPPCAHFGDILNNHTSPLNSDEQAGRPVDVMDRTVGQPAFLRLWLALVPMPRFVGGLVTDTPTVSFSLPKKFGEGC